MRKLLHKVAKKIRSDPFKLLLFFIAIVYFCCLITIMLYQKTGFFSALIFLMPAFLGQLQNISANIAEVARLIALASYVIFLGAIVTKMSEKVMNLVLIGGVTMNKVNYKNHLVICGWNYQAPKIIENLLSSDIYSKKQIVILADFEKIPYKSDKVDFIKGVQWKKEDLIRAGISTADTALILSDISSKSSNPDADSLLTVLAIETLNKTVYTCVQLLSSENKTHLENAGADEIICLDEIGGNLLVSSALNAGVSRIISSIVCFGKGSEIYKYKKPVPDKFIDKSFAEIAKDLIDKNMIMIAIETKKDEHTDKISSKIPLTLSGERILLVNPPGDYKLKKDDFLFILVEKEPKEL